MIKMIWVISRAEFIPCYIPGDPRKSDELVFLITSKVVKIEPSYWMEKKQNFMRIFSDINDLKIRPLVTTQRFD